MWNFDIVLSELKKTKKSQKELAGFLGVPEQRISDWKAGRIKSSWTEYIPKISEFLAVPSEKFDDKSELSGIKKFITIADDGLKKDFEDLYRRLTPEQREVVKAVMREMQHGK